MTAATWTAAAIAALNVVVVAFTLYAVARSNRRLSASVRIGTLQQMVSEMNRLRNRRAHDPRLERAMFEDRRSRTDEEIRQHILAVQLANIFEWAYLARAEDLLSLEVWRSWAETWRSVILESAAMRQAFADDSVWTFGRELEPIVRFLTDGGDIEDPSRFAREIGWKQRLDSFFGG